MALSLLFISVEFYLYLDSFCLLCKTATGQNAPTFLPKRHTFFQNKYYKKKFLCDSNVHKCLPAIRFCSNILFLFY